MNPLLGGRAFGAALVVFAPVLVLLPAIAMAEGKVTGSVATSGLSGVAPSGKATLDVKTIAADPYYTTTAEQWGLGGLYFEERGDDACVIGDLRTSMNGRYTAEVTSHEIVAPGCGGGNTGSKETVKFDKADHFIRAIQVCTTDKKSSDDKLKGAEIWAARVDTDGNVHVEDLSAKFRRTNCERWREKVSCPAGQVAIGIEATYGSNGFAGIRLRCKGVTRK